MFYESNYKLLVLSGDILNIYYRGLCRRYILYRYQYSRVEHMQIGTVGPLVLSSRPTERSGLLLFVAYIAILRRTLKRVFSLVFVILTGQKKNGLFSKIRKFQEVCLWASFKSQCLLYLLYIYIYYVATRPSMGFLLFD